MKKIVKSSVWPWSCFTAHGNQTVAVRGQQSPIEQTKIWKKHFRKFESTQWTVEQCWCQSLLPLGIIKCALHTGCAALQFLSPAEAMSETNEMRHFLKSSENETDHMLKKHNVDPWTHLQRGDLHRQLQRETHFIILQLLVKSYQIIIWKSQLGLFSIRRHFISRHIGYSATSVNSIYKHPNSYTTRHC